MQHMHVIHDVLIQENKINTFNLLYFTWFPFLIIHKLKLPRVFNNKKAAISET